MARMIAALATLLLLSACSTSTPLPSYYLLRSDIEEGTRALQTSAPFALGNLDIAPYIDQPGMLLETQSGDLRPARFHLWAEPLRDGAETFLLTAISNASGHDILPWLLNPTATRFDIRIDQLHGTYDGKAKLVAHWWLYDGDSAGQVYEYAGTEALTVDGYGALAKAQQALLDELAKAVAATLQPR
ncbi:MAG: membrane integrity-associated transporter subunit PqiC [Halioglobus sp.]